MVSERQKGRWVREEKRGSKSREDKGERRERRVQKLQKQCYHTNRLLLESCQEAYSQPDENILHANKDHCYLVHAITCLGLGWRQCGQLMVFSHIFLVLVEAVSYSVINFTWEDYNTIHQTKDFIFPYKLYSSYALPKLYLG